MTSLSSTDVNIDGRSRKLLWAQIFRINKSLNTAEAARVLEEIGLFFYGMAALFTLRAAFIHKAFIIDSILYGALAFAIRHYKSRVAVTSLCSLSFIAFALTFRNVFTGNADGQNLFLALLSCFLSFRALQECFRYAPALTLKSNWQKILKYLRDASENVDDETILDRYRGTLKLETNSFLVRAESKLPFSKDRIKRVLFKKLKESVFVKPYIRKALMANYSSLSCFVPDEKHTLIVRQEAIASQLDQLDSSLPDAKETQVTLNSEFVRNIHQVDEILQQIKLQNAEADRELMTELEIHAEL